MDEIVEIMEVYNKLESLEMDEDGAIKNLAPLILRIIEDSKKHLKNNPAPIIVNAKIKKGYSDYSKKEENMRGIKEAFRINKDRFY